jgi:probable addiction module antidote protein
MKKETLTTSLWDASEHWETDEDMIHYLQAALEDKEPDLFLAALGDVGRAKGMAQIAEKTGPGRTSLYKALSPDGHPEFETVFKVLDALGLKFSIAPKK